MPCGVEWAERAPFQELCEDRGRGEGMFKVDIEVPSNNVCVIRVAGKGQAGYMAFKCLSKGRTIRRDIHRYYVAGRIVCHGN